MRALRSSASFVAWAFVIAAALSCVSQREKALRAAFVTVNVARDGFVTFDRDRQHRIVQDAKTLEEGQAALAAYRTERDKVLAVFDDVYRALTAAVVAEDSPSLGAAQRVIKQLKQALDDLKKAGPL